MTLLLLLSSGQALRADTFPLFNPLNGHYYQVISGNISWDQAKTAAEGRSWEGMQGHLATITSSSEKDFISQNAGDLANGQYWLGGYQQSDSAEPDGGWRWVTDEVWGYTNWNAGEPNNSGGLENKTAFSGNGSGQWNDERFDGTLPGYLVEYDVPAAPPPPLELTAPVLVATGPSGRGAGMPTVSDLDGDHHLDVVVGANNGLVVLYGKGDGTFEIPVFHTVASGETYEVDVADLNNDNKPDVLFVCSGQNSVAVLYNPGGRTLNAPVFLPVGTRPFGVDAVDLNEDGWLDLAVSNHYDNNFSTLLNLQNGTFGPRTNYGAGSFTSLPTHGDYNRDGHQDVVVPNYVPGNYNIYFGNGAGGFNSGDNSRLGDYVAQMVTSDFNGDGIPDLASANMYSNTVSVLFGDGDGRFSQRATYGSGQYPHVLRAGDLDGDGAPELIVPNAGTGNVTIQRNTGEGYFTPDGPYFMAGVDARFVAVGDLDEDGRLDFMTTSHGQNRLVIRFNHTPIRPLAVPDQLTAGFSGVRRVQLTWRDRAWVETGYQVFRKRTIDPSFTLLATLPTDAESYLDRSVIPGTSYDYVVRAFNARETTGNSNVATISIPVSAEAPTDLTAAPVTGQRKINLAWSDPATNEIEYQVWRKPGAPGSGGNYTLLRRLPVDATSYLDTAVAVGATYSYYVTPFNPGGSPASNIASATVGTPPASPVDLTAIAAANALRVDLTWNDVSADETSFEVWRSGGGLSARRLVSLPADSESYSDSAKLVAATTYEYYVVAVNGLGGSASSPQSATTAPLPNAPRNLTVTTVAGVKRLDLLWVDRATNETGFELWRRPAGGVYARRAVLLPDSNSYIDTSVQTGASYSYYVVVIGPTGRNTSDEAYGTVAPLPTAPTGLEATAVFNTRRIDLTWSDASSNELRFEVWRKLNGGSFGRIATLSPNVQNYSDTGVVAGKTYVYYVAAVNNLGSNPSSQATATVDSAPAPATSLVASPVAGSLTIQLTWEDGGPQESSYQIWRKEGGLGQPGAFSFRATVAADSTTYTDIYTRSGRTYTYYVLAVSELGSSPSNQDDATAGGSALVPGRTPRLLAISPVRRRIATTNQPG
jgi:fibronectin type 3 domain-containing protein